MPGVPCLPPRPQWSLGGMDKGAGAEGCPDAGLPHSRTPCPPPRSPGLTGNGAGHGWTRGGLVGAPRPEPMKTHGGTWILSKFSKQSPREPPWREIEMS